jgi:alpha-tubulin suppressor-like RCC1 family protein
MKCWGYNGNGQLGYGDTNARGYDPGEMGDYLGSVNVGGSVSSVSLGYYHACAILTDLSAKCWGYNGYGQLGYGYTTQLGDDANEMGDYLPAINFGMNVLPA